VWVGLSNEFKFYLVNWNQICKSFQAGGLVILHLHSFNQALLGIWLWGFATEKDALWRRVVAIKYCVEWGGWCLVVGPHGVRLWKHIQRGWNQFSGSISFEVEVQMFSFDMINGAAMGLLKRHSQAL